MDVYRLLDFCKKLETVKKDKFDLRTYVSIEKYHEKLDRPIKELVEFDCQTTACAVGYLPVFYPDTFEYISQSSIGYINNEQHISSYQDSADYFELTDYQWDFLFETVCYSDFHEPINDPKQVIKHIKLLIECDGDVDRAAQCLEET